MVSAGGATSRYADGDRFRMQRIVGHRRTNLTECPGDALNGQLDTLRQRVQGRDRQQRRHGPGRRRHRPRRLDLARDRVEGAAGAGFERLGGARG